MEVIFGQSTKPGNQSSYVRHKKLCNRNVTVIQLTPWPVFFSSFFNFFYWLGDIGCYNEIIMMECLSMETQMKRK